MTAKSNGGPKMVTKTDSKSDMISRRLLTDKSIWVNSNLDEKFASTKSMFCKVGLYFDDSFEMTVKQRKPLCHRNKAK